MASFKSFIKKYNNLIFFIGGFLFDALTMTRIDSLIDIAIQAAYLSGITWLLIYQTRHQAGVWNPRGWAQRLWTYETEILHFFYGGLLSAYTVLYFKSTSLSKSLVFFALIALLMIANEMPQIRKMGNKLRLGLYAFCVVSFLNYLVPIILGTMGWWVFLLAWIMSGALVWQVMRLLEPYAQNLKWAPSVVLAIVFILYFLKWIPPVPMSVPYIGIFRNVERSGNEYLLTYRKPSLLKFWHKSERLYLKRDGDVLYCFARVFAPSRFEHHVYVRWSQYDEMKRRWNSSDRIGLSIKGGRDGGFRGFTRKENFSAGRWRVEVETDDGRVLSGRDFQVREDTSSSAYEMRQLRM